MVINLHLLWYPTSVLQVRQQHSQTATVEAILSFIQI